MEGKPRPFLLREGDRYMFNPVPQNWTDASKVCRVYNGHLAHPRIQAEADHLWAIMDKYGIQQVLAGFHDLFDDGLYFTAKGTLLDDFDFHEWAPYAPIGGDSRNCGSLKRDGFKDIACQDLHPSICEVNDESPGEGFKGYTYVPGHGYYKYYGIANVEWYYAVKSCYDEGSHLWIINSEEEAQAVTSATGSEDQGLWVGVHQRLDDRYFITIFDDTLESTGYNTWLPGEPNGSFKDYPFVAWNSGFLLDRQHETRTFVCEFTPSQ